MQTLKFILRASNALISFVTAVSLCVAGVYAGYALWDNSRVYAAAENIQADMLRFKPEIVDEKPSFEELMAINADVRAWITMDNTKIDYPVLQGETNLSYLNTDVYGNFALAGSIFLDSRNDGNFSDPYSLLYGHYMENSKMFGDLELYKDKDFFRENRTGTLILHDGVYRLEIYACLLISSTEDAIFNPGLWQADIDELLEFTEANALHLNRDLSEKVHSGGLEPKFLALTTCTSEYTDARIAVLTVMVPGSPAKKGGI